MGVADQSNALTPAAHFFASVLTGGVGGGKARCHCGSGRHLASGLPKGGKGKNGPSRQPTCYLEMTESLSSNQLSYGPLRSAILARSGSGLQTPRPVDLPGRGLRGRRREAGPGGGAAGSSSGGSHCVDCLLLVGQVVDGLRLVDRVRYGLRDLPGQRGRLDVVPHGGGARLA